MSLVKIYCILSFSLLYTCANKGSKESLKVKTNLKMSEIVVYISVASQIIFEDNSFKYINGEEVENINTIVKNNSIIVKPLMGKNTLSDTDAIFSLRVKSKDSEKVLKDLQSLDFVNGAYIKAQSEEPFEE